MSDPYQAYVSLLLHCNGDDNSTTFIDKSVYINTVTAFGNAAVKTAQSKFGGASLYLDGAGDFITAASAPSFNLAANDFTIEFWAYLLNGGHGGNWARFLQFGNNTTNGGLYLVSTNNANPATLLVQGYRSNSYFDLVAPGSTVSNSAWHHIALTKSMGVYRLFVDGALYGSSTPSPSYIHAQGTLFIGSNNGGTESLNAYIDEIRITNGVACYTADFTPPAAPFDDPAAPTGKVILLPASCDPIFGGRHRIASTVDRLGVAGPYPVRLYHRKSGRLVRSAWSDEAGNYQFDAIAYEAGGYFAVAHDVDHGELLNAGIADLITPEPM